MGNITIPARELRAGDVLIDLEWTVNVVEVDVPLGVVRVRGGRHATEFVLDAEVLVFRPVLVAPQQPGAASLIAEWRQASAAYAERAEKSFEGVPLVSRSVRMQLNATAATYGLCADELQVRVNALVQRWETRAVELTDGSPAWEANERDTLRYCIEELRGLL